MKNKKSFFLLSLLGYFLLLHSGCKQEAGSYTRGVGIYPGNPTEDFSPKLVADTGNYRNIARLRPAFHSSSYDYNLTAQLTTDGIIIKDSPEYIAVSTNLGALKKNEREWLFDGKPDSKYRMTGNDVYLQLEMSPNAPEITKLTLAGSVASDATKAKRWQFVCYGSNDGTSWAELGKVKGTGLPGKERVFNFGGMRPQVPGAAGSRPQQAGAAGVRPQQPGTANMQFGGRNANPERMINQTFTFNKPVAYHFYKISLSAPCATNWTFSDWDFYTSEKKLIMTPSLDFKSVWMSAGTGEEWVYVDLGVSSTFDHIKLHWINKAIKGAIQVSEDAKNWSNLVTLPGTGDLIDDINLTKKATGRFVKVLMTQAANDKKYALSELEVFGKGGMVAKAKTSPEISNNRMTLSGGNWKIQRSSEVPATGEIISKPGFNVENWVIATVPGTALVSYWNIGALPDPNFGDNQLQISESFFCSDFWYQNEFDVPATFKGERMFLNFDGINWKADIFVNGKKAGRIEGAFIRGKFDVTDLIIPGQKNAIAVLIVKNDNIGAIKEKTAISTDQNGGILGADNPTFHAVIGWDWIPTVRGRNIGIWNDVFLNVTGAVTIEDPFVTTDLALPDTTATDLNFEVTLQNHKAEAVSGTLSGKYGNIKFEQKVSLNSSESKVVKLNSTTNPTLHFKNPKLWWPKGYGAQNLYDVELSFKTATGVSDIKEFKSGVREMAFDETNQILNIYINGRRFIGRGGNWGFPESNLNYRGREYDAAVAYHADMNFTMIRNWVGQTGDVEFFEACDRYGVMVWEDFWLANPVDGPNPNDPAMFMKNAKDFVKLIRNHPSIALYVGRNEGSPPKVIDSAIRVMLPEIHPGLHYISSSSQGVVSGGGPYRALPVRDYFTARGGNKFHSERGMPNVMTYESLKQTLPESALWPHNSMWGMHDFTLEGAQRGASFIEMVEKGFGPVDNAKKFTELAQWINYNGYRAMFEGRSQFRQGLLLWMSHPSWPSMVWQTYDYYLEPTAAYFACKKASEPIHVQWNVLDDNVEVVNSNAKDKVALTVSAQLINMDGSVQWNKEAVIDCKEDSTAKCFKLEFPTNMSSVNFIKLTLKKGNKTISENFYWRGLEDGNYQALNSLPVIELKNNTSIGKSGKNWELKTTLNNTSKSPVLMIRLKVVGKNSGERILPVFYSDNYVALMPGEKKVITMLLKDEDTRGEKPAVVISGFNVSVK